MNFDTLHPVHYIPAITTVLSALFCIRILMRYFEKGYHRTGGGNHLLWWAFGVFTYGAGTALEASITFFGNSVGLNKAWYIAGAIFGGYPLAQGSVYLHFQKKTANRLTFISLSFVIAASIFVILSPVNIEAMQAHRPSGAILEWRWVRLLTPFINLYAVIFLIGSAIQSAIKFAAQKDTYHRAVGNALIAVGAILPGIGGASAKGGLVEALYIAEFIGIILIWLGFLFCIRKPFVNVPVSVTG